MFNHANTPRAFTIICLGLNIYLTIIKAYSHFLIQKLVLLACRILRFLYKSLYFADFSKIKTRLSDIQISPNISTIYVLLVTGSYVCYSAFFVMSIAQSK